MGVAVFYLVERRAKEPLLPLEMFRMKTFAVSSLAALAIGGVLFGITIYVPVYMQGVLGVSATSSGVVLIPLTLGWVVASFTSGQLITKTGRYKIYTLLGSSLVLIGSALLVLLDEDSSSAVASLFLVVIGLGMGAMFQTYVIATQNRVPQSELGVATAAIQFFRSMGGSLAVAGLGALLTAPARRGHRREPADRGRGPRERGRALGAGRRDARRVRGARAARRRRARALDPAAGGAAAHARARATRSATSSNSTKPSLTSAVMSSHTAGSRPSRGARSTASATAGVTPAHARRRRVLERAARSRPPVALDRPARARGAAALRRSGRRAARPRRTARAAAARGPRAAPHRRRPGAPQRAGLHDDHRAS